MANGTYQEVPDAEIARVEGDAVEGRRLVCLDANGKIVATFDAKRVSAYGKHAALRVAAHEGLEASQDSSSRQGSGSNSP
jgi:hypothetical protein